jgi:hypothetical protein
MTNQYDPDLQAQVDVPVEIKNKELSVRSLPASSWTVTRFQLSDTVGPVRAISRNPYRKRVLLHGDAPFLYGSSTEQVRTRDTAGLAGANMPVELTHTEEVWINNEAAGTPDVTVNEESWPS